MNRNKECEKLSIENMKKVKARIGFEWRKHWNASTLIIQFSQWEVCGRKICAVEKAEVSANQHNEAIG